ncbi:hypothetical protein HYS47_04360 [Candidatus Woesearchaeota archaeon]|nr:hypothetical protein [Candidatus Woesearchaeota archaeon]
MKISIDTKEDSPEDIRKVISMLSSLMSNQSAHQFLQQDQRMEAIGTPTLPGDGGLFDMFNANKSSQESATMPSSTTSQDVMGITPMSTLGPQQKDDKREDVDIYKIETY